MGTKQSTNCMNNKEFTDAVREPDKRVAHFMTSQIENANGVLSTASNSRESAGIMKTAMSAWTALQQYGNQQSEMDDMTWEARVQRLLRTRVVEDSEDERV